MPEIVGDLEIPGQLRPVLRYEPTQRENLQEGPAGEQHDQEHGDEKARNGVADDDHRAGPHIEARSVLHRLANAERNRDRIGEQGHPQAERDRDRHLLSNQAEHAGIAEIALTEIEQQIVLDHHEEALIGRLVEAELLLQARDEFGIEPLRAAIFGWRRYVPWYAALALLAREVAAPAAEHRGGAHVGAAELRDQLLDRTARRELHDHEGHEHDAEHRWHDEQQAAKDISGHSVRADLPNRTTK